MKRTLLALAVLASFTALRADGATPASVNSSASVRTEARVPSSAAARPHTESVSQVEDDSIAVPEAGSLILLGSGLVFTASFVRRRYAARRQVATAPSRASGGQLREVAR